MENDNDPILEINAMKVIADEFKSLDDGARKRVLRWAAERFGKAVASEVDDELNGENFIDSTNAVDGSFESIADLFAVTEPISDADKALVVGYWFQVVKGEHDFDTQKVNSELKHLGYGVGNITRAFEKLKKQKPQLVIQTRKFGTTKQARKKFKLTAEGEKVVARMIS
ncbi:MAG: hypothetical protein KC553_11155 [Nitrospina sp.]|nr:hypothetical protein [Nitrospina sp.]